MSWLHKALERWKRMIAGRVSAKDAKTSYDEIELDLASTVDEQFRMSLQKYGRGFMAETLTEEEEVRKRIDAWKPGVTKKKGERT